MANILQLSGVERNRLASCQFVILPLGSIEYHGPHAPLGTDTTLAVGFAEALASYFNTIILPPITYTFTPSITSEYQGTLSIPPDVFLSYLQEVLQAVTRSGARRILALNGHSENQYSARLAAEKLALTSPDSSVLVVNWWKLANDSEGIFSQGGGHGHGGPLEISTTAAFDPRGVVSEAAGNIDYESAWWRAAAQIVGAGQAPSGFAGYHGKTDEIAIDKGTEVIRQVVANMRRLVEEWLERAG